MRENERERGRFFNLSLLFDIQKNIRFRDLRVIIYILIRQSVVVATAESREIFACAWHDIVIKFEHYSPEIVVLLSEPNVEEASRSILKG